MLSAIASLIVSIFSPAPGSYIYPVEREIPAEEIKIENLSTRELITHFSSIDGINDEVPVAIASAESQFQNVCNKEKGCVAGIGIYQIVQSTFDEQCVGSPYNIIDNVRCGVKMIAEGQYWRWKSSISKWLPTLSELTKEKIEALCSCVSGLRSFGITMPPTASILYNSAPQVGGVILFSYNSTKHWALIIEMTPEYYIIKETNYFPCRYSERKVDRKDPTIYGFYDPEK